MITRKVTALGVGILRIRVQGLRGLGVEVSGFRA